LVLLIVYVPTLSVPMLLFLFFLLGFFACGQVISYPTMAESNPARLTSTALSIVAITLNLGSAITQPMFGWIMHWHYSSGLSVTHYRPNDYLAALIILPVVSAIALLLSLKVKETYCKPLDESSPA